MATETATNDEQRSTSEATTTLRDKIFRDVSSAACGALVMLGDRLGLYRAMADAGPLDSIDLARKTGASERYLRDWLAAQAAAGYVEYDSETERYYLSREQAALLANEEDPKFCIGGFETAAALYHDEPRIAEAYRLGVGMSWCEYSPLLHRGYERFFGGEYVEHLVGDWIPALNGIAKKLEEGGSGADIGCGRGVATAILARAYPRSTFVGFDPHAPSIELARNAAGSLGEDGRARFEIASAKSFPGSGYDLITCLHSLQDLGDPTGAVAHIRNALSAEGSFLVVAPAAGHSVEKNLHPIGQFYYSLSAMVHGPGSRSQEIGACLGAQASEDQLKELLFAGGFGRVRHIAQTDLHLVLEARG